MNVSRASSDRELSQELLRDELHPRKNAAVVLDFLNLVSLTEDAQWEKGRDRLLPLRMCSTKRGGPEHKIQNGITRVWMKICKKQLHGATLQSTGNRSAGFRVNPQPQEHTPHLAPYSYLKGAHE